MSAESNIDIQGTVTDVLLAAMFFYSVVLFIGTWLDIFSLLDFHMEPLYGFIIVALTAAIFSEMLLVQDTYQYQGALYVSYTFVGIGLFILGAVGVYTGWFFQTGGYVLLTYVALGLITSSAISGVILAVDD